MTKTEQTPIELAADAMTGVWRTAAEDRDPDGPIVMNGSDLVLAAFGSIPVEGLAGVLLLHASFRASPEIQEPDTPWWWECDGCATKVAQGGTGRSDVFTGLATHQAEAIVAWLGGGA